MGDWIRHGKRDIYRDRDSKNISSISKSNPIASTLIRIMGNVKQLLENTNKNKEKSDWDKMRTPSTLTSSSSEESSEYENDEEKQSLKETRTTNINVNVRLIHSFNLEYRVRSFIIVFYV